MRLLRECADFRTLFIAGAVSATGDALVPLALVFGVIKAGGSPSDLSWVLASGALPPVLFTLFGGALADRCNKKWLVIVADLARAGTQVGIGLLFLSGTLALGAVCALAFLTGCARALGSPAMQSLVPEVVPSERLGEAIALWHTVRNACFLAGTPLAGILVAAWGAGPVLIYDGCTFLVAAALLLTLPQRTSVRAPHERTDGGSGYLSDIVGGLRLVWRIGWMRAELLRSLVELPLVVAPFFLLGPVVAEDKLGGAAAWAWISTGFMAGMTVGPTLATRFAPRRPMLVGTLVMYSGVLPPLLLAVTSSTILVVVAETAKGAAVGFLGAIWGTLIQERIPENARGRISACDYVVTNALLPFGYVVAAPIGSYLGATNSLILSAAIVAVGVTIQASLPSVRHLTALHKEV